MTRRPWFWIALILVSAGCLAYTWRYFPEACPLISLDLKMSRAEALSRAGELAARNGWGPTPFRPCATFDVDEDVKNFIELKAGGTEALKQVMKDRLYAPYQWKVRLFDIGVPREAQVRFTPEGHFYGFAETIPETDPGAALAPEAARQIAEEAARTTWRIPLAEYVPAETSQQVKKSGRTDHTFVYERPDRTIGEGRYRLRLTVSGDRLTELTHLVKIPESFTRDYQSMRSANRVVSMAATVAAALVLVIGGCLIGLIVLMRQRWVLWKRPLAAGAIMAVLLGLAQANQLPLAWAQYDTALTAGQFIAKQAVNMVMGAILLGGLIAVVLMAAESLTRKAFPAHPQMWRWWSRDSAASTPILGQTLAGFLLVALFLAYETAFYRFSIRSLGWWTPSESWSDPNVVATWFPWLTPLVVALQAGILEESLFRAVPIAGAALLGQRFGARRLWIGAAIVVQALIFGAAHGEYPQQPAYARLVELIIPSVFWGLVYLRFGLLPGMVMHFAIDATLMELPLFVSSAPGITLDRALVVLLALTPLWVLLAARLRAGRWRDLPASLRNAAWSPPEKPAAPPAEAPARQTAVLSPRAALLLAPAGLAGLLAWFLLSDFRNPAPPLALGRAEAIERARSALARQAAPPPEGFEPQPRMDSKADRADRFVWQEGGPDVYRQLAGVYVPSPHWQVRWVRWASDAAERAEEYAADLAGTGTVLRVRHALPEARPGASLAEGEARDRAHAALRERFGLDPARLKEVSAVSEKWTARTDWTFIFSDPAGYPLTNGEARLEIALAGEAVSDARRFVYVPEQADRLDRRNETIRTALQVSCLLLRIVIILAGAVAGAVAWGRSRFSLRAFLLLGGGLLLLEAACLGNGWPQVAANFNTAMPFAVQAGLFVLGGALGAVFVGGSYGMLAGWLGRQVAPVPGLPRSRALLAGIGLGCVAAGLAALAGRAGHSLTPGLPDYDAAASLVPAIQIACATLKDFVKDSVLILLGVAAMDRLTQGWSRRRILFALLVTAGGLVVAGNAPHALVSWGLAGLMWGVAFWLGYRWILGSHPELVPVITGTVFVLCAIHQACLQANPALIAGAALAVPLVALSAWLGFRCLSPSSPGATPANAAQLEQTIP